MNKNITVIFSCLFLIIFGLWAMRWLNHPGFYTSHDGWHIVARLHHFQKAISDGQFPPRFSADLLHGFGYPLFIFSYHLPWWLALPWLYLGADIFSAIKIIFILTYVLSGLVMYLWIKEMWGNSAGITASFLYMFTPYRFANIFVRANMGEAVSFAFIPLIFWAIFRLTKHKGFKTIFLGALGISGFLLSHIMVSFLFFIPLVLYWFIHVFQAVKKKTFILLSLLIGTLGIGIASYYLLPAIVYQPQTVFKDLYKDLYANHFTPLAKLIYSPWGYGALGTSGEMSRQVGIVLWMVSLFAVLFLLFKLMKKQWGSRESIMSVFLFSFYVSILLMLEVSQPIWRIISSIAIIDFPWRFLAVTTLCASVVAGGLVSMATKKYQLIIILFLMVCALYTNRNHLHVNQYTDIPLSLYLDSEQTTNTDDEYLPKWVNREHAKKIHPLMEPIPEKFQLLTKNSYQTEFTYAVTQPTETQVNQMYFPGWTFLIGNTSELVSQGNNGRMKVTLNPEFETGLIIFKPTFVMRLGELISIISLACIFLLYIRQRARFKLNTDI